MIDEHQIDDDDDDAELAEVHGDLSALTADEVRRRTEAPLPRSLLDFLE